MKIKRKSRIFVGYQMRSRWHSKALLRKLIDKVKYKIGKKENVDLEIQYGEFHPGEFLFSEVFNAIKNCEIAIFDISENNPNVLIEVGMSYGIGKYVILLKNNLSREKYKVPSDVGAFIYLPYRNNTTISSDSTCNKIVSAISAHYKKISHSIYYKLLWGFNEGDLIYIVCPELEKPKKRQEPEPEEFLYLGKYGDIDSLVALQVSLSRLYPMLQIKVCTSEEFSRFPGTPYANNLIVIGGPDYNKVAKTLMKYTPFEFIEKGKAVLLKIKQQKVFFKAKFQRRGGIEEVIDYGFFYKMPNPHNDKKKLIMINGIHTYGVYGAAKCFSLNEECEADISISNCKIIINELGDNPNFATVLEVKSTMKNVITPKIRKENLIPL